MAGSNSTPEGDLGTAPQTTNTGNQNVDPNTPEITNTKNQKVDLVSPEDICFDNLKYFIDKEKPGLRAFYDDDKLKATAILGAAMTNQLLAKGCDDEIASDLAILTLYDIVMLIDDSSSMRLAEVVNGKPQRIETLRKAMNEITGVYDLANSLGMLSVRFMNGEKGRKNVTSAKVNDIVDNHAYIGITRIGTALKRKILDWFVMNPDPNRSMKKPLLVMVMTDGGVEGERKGLLFDVIKSCANKLEENGGQGMDAVAFHFSQVGNDEGAAKLLRELDDDIDIGDYVDCLPATSRLEELDDPDLKWALLAKLLLGAILERWDMDDKAALSKECDDTGRQQKVNDYSDEE